MQYTTLKILLCALLLAPVVQAAELQTDWIEPVAGQSEKTLGASVKSVEADESGDNKVTISIPKSALTGDPAMEEVVVVGQKPDKSEQRLDIRHEWVADYDKDNYGLVLYLGKDGSVPLRLYLKAE